MIGRYGVAVTALEGVVGGGRDHRVGRSTGEGEAGVEGTVVARGAGAGGTIGGGGAPAVGAVRGGDTEEGALAGEAGAGGATRRDGKRGVAGAQTDTETTVEEGVAVGGVQASSLQLHLTLLIETISQDGT